MPEKTPIAPEKESAAPAEERTGLRSRFAETFDNLLFVVSIWLTLMIYFGFNDKVPNLHWPWYADRIMFGLILFFLIDFTLEILRPFLLLAAGVGIIVLIIMTFTRNKVDRTTTQQPYQVLHNNNMTLIYGQHEIVDRGDLDNSLSRLDSQNQTLQAQIGILKIKLDSLENLAN